MCLSSKKCPQLMDGARSLECMKKTSLAVTLMHFDAETNSRLTHTSLHKQKETVSIHY